MKPPHFISELSCSTTRWFLLKNSGEESYLRRYCTDRPTQIGGSMYKFQVEMSPQLTR